MPFAEELKKRMKGKSVTSRVMGKFEPPEEQRSDIDGAISDEKEAIGVYEKMLNQTTDPKEKKVLEGILHDEQRHQKLLEQMSKGKLPEPMDFGSDIKVLKKEGYSLQDIYSAIDEDETIDDKDAAKEKAEKEFGDNRAQISIIRHGNTHLNSTDKIRGWKDVPLDDKGRKQGKALGKELKGSGIDGMITSDLIRAKETAEIIHKETGIPILEISRAFRPWDMGDLTGMESEKAMPIAEEYAKDKPDEAIPHGESFNKFKDRFLSGIEKVQEDYPGQKIGIVTHHRGDRVMAAWEAAGMPEDHSIDMNVFLQKGIPPAGARDEGKQIEGAKEVPDDTEFAQEVKDLKRKGYTLPEIIDAIEASPEVEDKEKAKEDAKKHYA